ncbi:hypothetical protein [Lysinibacillus sp. LZ02]|uniref:hypothetical protein n=1 Tax=Lysinibacillus sp. LZ02 TaxID=3420668 RepID=UPI003D3605CA
MIIEIIVALLFFLIGIVTWRFQLIEFVGYYHQAERSYNKPARVTRLIGLFLIVNGLALLLLGYLRLNGLGFLYVFFIPTAFIAALFLRAKVRAIQQSKGELDD